MSSRQISKLTTDKEIAFEIAQKLARKVKIWGRAKVDPFTYWENEIGGICPPLDELIDRHGEAAALQIIRDEVDATLPADVASCIVLGQ